MKVTKVNYQKIFPTGMAYLNHKIGVEMELDEGDSETQVFLHARALVEQWNIESNPSYAMTMEYMKPNVGTVQAQYSEGVTPTNHPLNPPSKDQRIQSFIATINMCTSLKFLENFRTRVEQENNWELTKAFNDKLMSIEEKINQ